MALSPMMRPPLQNSRPLPPDEGEGTHRLPLLPRQRLNLLQGQTCGLGNLGGLQAHPQQVTRRLGPAELNALRSA